MKQFYRSISLAILFGITSISFGQEGQGKTLEEQWAKVKSAQMNLSETVIQFCNYPELQATYKVSSSKIKSIARSFFEEVKGTSVLDSSIVSRIEMLQDSLLRSLANLADKIEKDRILQGIPAFRNLGRKMEYSLEDLGRKIHDFNYIVHELERLNIRFHDINW